MNSNEISENLTEEESEPDESILWDGSETDHVSDDSEEYEEPQTGIRLNYILTPDDIYTYFCVQNSHRQRKTIFQSVLLGVLSILFFVSYISSRVSGTLFFALISAMLIPVLWFVPQIVYRRQSVRLADGQKISMEIYPDEINLTAQKTNINVPLDGSVRSVRKKNDIIFFLPETDKTVILPLRCIEPDDLAEVTAMVQSGTVFEMIE